MMSRAKRKLWRGSERNVYSFRVMRRGPRSGEFTGRIMIRGKILMILKKFIRGSWLLPRIRAKAVW